MLQNITPRRYQEEIFNTCRDKNCLVVLPTGIGKTLIVLMLAIESLRKHPDNKVLFLAPTRPLAEQHLEYFKKHLPELFATMEIFTGSVPADKRKKLWQNADIIFSTPQCISNDIRNNLYDLSDACLLIEDEAHRCIRNYDYTYVAKHYLENSINARVLGLTASPGSDKARIQEICRNLGIEALELRTRNSDDVREYLQELKIEIIKIDYPEEIAKIRNLLKIIYDKKINELKNRKLLFGPPTKKTILELQTRLIRMITTGNRNFNNLAGSSTCAQAIKLQHAIELIETQTLETAFQYLKELFDQSAKKKSKAVQNLVKQKEFNEAYISLTELISRKVEHPKLSRVKDVVKEEINDVKKRAIIFTQYRATASRICKELNSLQNINARVFVGQLKKGDTGLSQREQKELLDEFRAGKINLLVATSIGEEGLDLPEVSLVVFYEPIPSAIRKIQRGGRTARLKPGKIITLVTQKTRDETYYWAAFHKEKRMHSAIDSINKDFRIKEQVINKEQKTLEEFNNSDSVKNSDDKEEK